MRTIEAGQRSQVYTQHAPDGSWGDLQVRNRGESLGTRMGQAGVDLDSAAQIALTIDNQVARAGFVTGYVETLVSPGVQSEGPVGVRLIRAIRAMEATFSR